jgi:hypothetical protein
MISTHTLYTKLFQVCKTYLIHVFPKVEPNHALFPRLSCIGIINVFN